MNVKLDRVVEMDRWSAEHAVKRTSKELIERLRWLAQDLIRAAEEIESDPEDGMFHSSGIVQSRGNDVDRLVGKLHAEREALRVIRRIASRIEGAKEEVS